MPAATCKADLLEVTQKEYRILGKLTAPIAPKSATQKDADGISIKDIIAHRAHWIGLFFGWYEDGLAGRPVYFPAKGYKWNDLNRYNAKLRASTSHLNWQQALAELDQNHLKLVDFIEQSSDAALYGGPMKGAHNSWTPGRWAEAAGSSHYRSASKYIRARLRAQ